MTVVLAAHGTRNPHGVAMIGDLAAAMSRRLEETVRVAFVDVLGPSPSDVLAALPDDEQVVVVPAFLARGYHVRADLPAHLAAAWHPRTVLTTALGPSPALADAASGRLREAGYRPGDTVVFAAAGSSDRHAVTDVRRAATRLESVLGTAVTIGFAAPPAGSAYPGIADAVRRARRRPGRVAIASYLLADGLFQRRLADSGADLVAAPLGLHPRVVDLACRRVLAAQQRHADRLSPSRG
ncbi:sirohydrochlorin chelatase [Gordonia sp. PP30]|uniref:sirohydrochlorin chelatase n=1 Tax=Gordonia sp. PP30 TaxID=2935861 RepID=UPI00200011D2|nr:sirohydrochlorin chelatase [Gordonia sp. PP30]UQE76500.1 sirohydrochlorin chelatase [Gordonia sp. PP30]